MERRFCWLEELKRENIEKIRRAVADGKAAINAAGGNISEDVARIWQDVVDGKAAAINAAGGVISGEMARILSPHVGSWVVRYLNKVESWTLSNGVLGKE
jgi:GMP synthase PP-ATPase subunit